jgi:hypothetical protein
MALSDHAVPDRDFRPVAQPLSKKWSRMLSAFARVKEAKVLAAT